MNGLYLTMAVLSLLFSYSLVAYLLYPVSGGWNWRLSFWTGVAGTGMAVLVLALGVLSTWPPVGVVSVVFWAALGSLVAWLLWGRPRWRRGAKEVVAPLDEYRTGTGNGSGL